MPLPAQRCTPPPQCPTATRSGTPYSMRCATSKSSTCSCVIVCTTWRLVATFGGDVGPPCVQEQTQRMVRQYADSGGADASARAQTIADVAANLSSVSSLMRNVKQRLGFLQQQSAAALEGLTVTPRASSGAQDSVFGSGALGSHLTPRRGTASLQGEAPASSMLPPGSRGGGGGGGGGGAPGAPTVFTSIAEPSGKWNTAVDKVRVMQRASARFMAKRGKDETQSRALHDVGSGDLGM